MISAVETQYRAVDHDVLDDMHDQHRELGRITEAVRKRNGTGQTGVEVTLHREQGGGAEQAGGDANDADTVRAQLARSRQDHADDPALRGGIGSFAALAL